MKRALLVLLALLLLQPGSAQLAHCDCPDAMRHLCRCGVLIEQDVAEIQLSYLNRLLRAEFADYLEESPVASVRLVSPRGMLLQGEAAQGFFENGEIVLNSGLRRDQALMVLAHELGHAWHFSERTDADDISDFMVEGFAEWVSFHLCRRAGLTEFSYSLRNNRDPLYGEACRWYLDLEKKHGRGAVVKVMRSWLNEDGKPRLDTTRTSGSRLSKATPARV